MNSTARKKARAKLVAVANAVLNVNTRNKVKICRLNANERLCLADRFETLAAQLRLSAAILDGRKIKPATRPQARADALYLRQARN